MMKTILILLFTTATFNSFTQPYYNCLCVAAVELTKQNVVYDPAYYSIDYPNGDIPGDIVSWNLGGNVTHIGIVVNIKSTDGLRNMILHNIGQGQVLKDCLFDYKIIGHYRYRGP